MSTRHLALGITGASGSIYGLTLCRELLRSGARVSLVITSAGFAVLKTECGLDWQGCDDLEGELCRYLQADPERLSYYAENDFCAPIASGSSAPDQMIVAPCSMGTLARIAQGVSGNLLERTADVMLKEGRPLILVPRETPLNAIHLENMLKLARLGVRLVPAMPAFYQGPKTLEDLVDFVVGKVLDAAGVEHALFRRWGN
ncbi:flavin prenyltransferase UbiX [Geomonas limicola]|uniref:Flavin prenyltransferase UbiX n=1 Tax=Geomonas limicola TaxID=2740186 RepID=A0A6V8N5I6_9BACT|nr:flavin prenyltransferase UbiX [Geomonas limicola]GFO67204.1 flavin prenyltransferase UbiX [Geomonas limicola]